MSVVLYANDIKTVIADVGGISAGDLTLDVGDASAFPAITGGDYLYLTLVRLSDLAVERVKATAISGSTVTITRAQEGTTALAFDQNDRVLGAISKGLLDDIRAEIDAAVAANAVVAAEASAAAAAASAAAAQAQADIDAITPIDTADIAADAIDGTLIEDDAVNSEHIAAGAIDAEHFSAGCIGPAALATDAVETAKIDDGAVTAVKIADATITNAKLSTTAGELGGAWQTWTPTMSNFTHDAGTLTARYIQIGKTVHYVFYLKMGTGDAMGTAPSFTTPVTAKNALFGTREWVAGFGMCGTSTPSGDQVIVGYMAANGTKISLYYLDANAKAAYITASVPFTWSAASAHDLILKGSYEVE